MARSQKRRSDNQKNYKTGCRTKPYQNHRGKYVDFVVEGWYWSRPSGFLRCVAMETKNSVVNEKGRINVMLEVVNLTHKSKSQFLAFMDKTTGVVVSKEAQIVMNPGKGYCGPGADKKKGSY